MEIAWRNRRRSAEGVVPTKVGNYQGSVYRLNDVHAPASGFQTNCRHVR